LASTNLMTNREKLKELLIEVFLIDPSEFRFDVRRDEIDTWDSLGVVSMAVGIQEVFGYHLTQDEALSVQSVPDVIRLLQSKGIAFDA
jgi:acyl carrier protein